METIQLIGSTLGLAFCAGIRLYATVLVVGLGVRLGWLALPPHLSELSVLASPIVLMTAAIIYVVEFIADKIPWVDSLWDSVHTFIRPLGAAAIGFAVFSDVDPAAQIAMFLACGAVGLSSHSTKAGTRLIANHSPEPFSNVGLSFFEDALVIGASWLSIKSPLVILSVVAVFFVLFLFFAPRLLRLLHIETLALQSWMTTYFGSDDASPADRLFEELPDRWARKLGEDGQTDANGFRIRCFSGKGLKIGKNYFGFLCLTNEKLFFIAKKRFRLSRMDFSLDKIESVRLDKKILMDRLTLQYAGTSVYWYLLKNPFKIGESVVEILKAARTTHVQ